ncbi:MAG: alpha-1,4-glucan--maltose-1-phosphate maltosyltransferase [Acidobacteriota bacterium]|nr:alpha-1,4-glucan--maltose-1-phosphate maltosyltransferase [Acidobacteriota bacterium]
MKQRAQMTPRNAPRIQSAPSRVMITHIYPEIECGRFPIKRIEGDTVTVTADIFADGHDLLSAVLCYREKGQNKWMESPMQELGNDAWMGKFEVGAPGICEYTIEAWPDRFRSWARDLAEKVNAMQEVWADLPAGARWIEEAGGRAAGAGEENDARTLGEIAVKLRQWASARNASGGMSQVIGLVSSQTLAWVMRKYPDRRCSASCERPRLVVVDRKKARFSTWYELFPRSCSPVQGGHGTFEDCASRLPAIAAMGFDVVYLPPIHPIGRTNRKGKNNAQTAAPGDPGSPWAIGAIEGGHTSIHPSLGVEEDFKMFVAKANAHFLEVALDLAYQCSPDHPWVKEHPDWFVRRQDGTVQYAENPPKKYEDIYPLNFECDDWRNLWEALKGIVFFWISRDVKIFRVDNPHTKPFAFWEWLIQEVKSKHPEVIFLAEAFTRPKVMQRLAMLGFSQSYSYFAWRNSRQEIIDYFTELTRTSMREYFRPNLWPNTPDILTEFLQHVGKPAFMIRLMLAATLGANYGIYGPAFELCENVPLAPGSEEYLHAEKYEIRQWRDGPTSGIKDLITKVNRARRENPALQNDFSLRFHGAENDQIIAYSKESEDRRNLVLCVINLDPRNAQTGWVTLPLEELGFSPQSTFQVRDLLTDICYQWHGPRNYVRLDPFQLPAHLLQLRHEESKNFEYID